MTPSSLPSGLYDLLLTENLERLLASDATAQRQIQPVAGGAADFLSDALARQLSALLEDLPGEGAEAAHRQLALVNDLLKQKLS